MAFFVLKKKTHSFTGRNSLYINFYYYLCIKLQHQGVE